MSETIRKALKELSLASMFLAIGLVLPFFTGQIPQVGSMMLPMHIPVLLCGMLCGWPFGLVCGLIGPALSSLLTGMPPPAVLPGMMVECAVYGCASGVLMHFVRTGNRYADLYISLVPAMLLGRVISGIVKALILTPGLSLTAWATASFVTALPGIAIQLVLIPALLLGLERAKVIPKRY